MDRWIILIILSIIGGHHSGWSLGLGYTFDLLPILFFVYNSYSRGVARLYSCFCVFGIYLQIMIYSHYFFPVIFSVTFPISDLVPRRFLLVTCFVIILYLSLLFLDVVSWGFVSVLLGGVLVKYSYICNRRTYIYLTPRFRFLALLVILHKERQSLCWVYRFSGTNIFLNDLNDQYPFF